MILKFDGYGTRLHQSCMSYQSTCIHTCIEVCDFNACMVNGRIGCELFLGPHAVPVPINDNGKHLLDT